MNKVYIFITLLFFLVCARFEEFAINYKIKSCEQCSSSIIELLTIYNRVLVTIVSLYFVEVLKTKIQQFNLQTHFPATYLQETDSTICAVTMTTTLTWRGQVPHLQFKFRRAAEISKHLQH